MNLTATPHVAVLGGEPAALACAARLLREGAKVTHFVPAPWGLLGASRDIGLAYPELGEPYERLAYAVGEEAAAEFHRWGRQGIALLSLEAQESESLRRGSRLWLARHEQEAQLAGFDALHRSRAVGDEVRLMSGAAGSNYAPLSTLVHQAGFETHAVSFVPTKLCEALYERLRQHENYSSVELAAEEEWRTLRVDSCRDVVRAVWGEDESLECDVVVVAGGLETSSILGKFEQALVPLLGQAFLSAPLRETTRASVVGLSASWGYERYRFDPDRRLLGCGIDPGNGIRHEQAVALPEVQEAFWKRALGLFADLAQSGEPIAQWGVLFTTSCDGLPLLGPLPGEPRVHVATGFSTSAWSRGYAAGEELAKCLAGQEASLLMQRCSPRRLL